MNILLCFNDYFVPLARVLIISLMCHHSELHFYIGYTNLSETNRNALTKLVEDKCPQGNWPWDIGEYHKDSFTRTIKFLKYQPNPDITVNGRFSLDTWTRCFIWEEIHVDRLLYLDADIIVNGNLEQFYNDDLGDNLLKACPEYVNYGGGYCSIGFYNRLVRLGEEHGYKNKFGHYCNAGVVLFNLSKMRAEGLTADTFLEFCKKLTRPLRMNDQDFINLFFDNRIKLANPYRYNCLIPPLSYMKRKDFPTFSEFDMSESPFPRSETAEITPTKCGAAFVPDDIIIYHYNSQAKPDSGRYHYSYAEVFWHYKLLDPCNTELYRWTKFQQKFFGFIRRLIPEYPLALSKKR